MYPQPGRPLVPDQLKSFVGGWRLPTRLAKAHGLPPTMGLADLDEELAKARSQRSIGALSDEVIRAVQARFGEIELSKGIVQIDPHDRNLSVRARNCVFRAGYQSADGPVNVTLGELAALRNLGARTLLELLVTTPAIQGHPGRPSPAVKKAASTMGKRRWSRRVSSSDPRVGERLRALNLNAETAYEVAELLTKTPFDPRTARQVARDIRDLVVHADRLRRMTLEDELQDIVLSLTPTPFAARAVLLRFGFSGDHPMTLEAVGNELEVTRERVRQIQKRFMERIEQHQVWTPTLDRALRFIERSVPSSTQNLELNMNDQHLTKASFPVQSLIRAAELFGKKAGFVLEVESGVVHALGNYVPANEVRSTAARLVTHWGATTIEELRAVLEGEGHSGVTPSALQGVLEVSPSFYWLDDVHEWFWLSNTPRNRLLNQIEKIMSVAGSIDIGSLRDGVGRNHRMKGFRPPREVLARLCQTSGLYRREGEMIIEGPALRDWREVLRHLERTLVDILFEHGPVMRREELEHLAIERGIKVNSFYVYLSYSPVLARFAPGVFGLRGARISAAEVQALIPPRARKQRLLDHGWTTDGDVWIGYKASSSTVQSGVISAPASLKSVIEGSFDLYTEDETPIGTLAVRDATIWGLSPFFRRRGVEKGDHLVVRIDIRTGRATVTAGDEGLLLKYQTAE